MTALRVVFIEDVSEAYENGLRAGVFSRDTAAPEFFTRFEYLASDSLYGVIVADHFKTISNHYLTVSRKDSP